jgi:phosphopantetheinyl transferase
VPLYTQNDLDQGATALWLITESKEELLAMLPAAWRATIDLTKVSAHNLAARVLAHTVCPNFDILEKDEFGKPYFDSEEYKISITHAGDFAGFMYTQNRECGIDMEEITERIRRIQTKFVREDEEAFLTQDLRGLYAIWCAKEAMYKFYGLKALDFKKHLKIDYAPLAENGSLRGHINKGEYSCSLELKYYFFDNYLILHTA